VYIIFNQALTAPGGGSNRPIPPIANIGPEMVGINCDLFVMNFADIIFNQAEFPPDTRGWSIRA